MRLYCIQYVVFIVYFGLVIFRSEINCFATTTSQLINFWHELPNTKNNK